MKKNKTIVLFTKSKKILGFFIENIFLPKRGEHSGLPVCALFRGEVLEAEVYKFLIWGRKLYTNHLIKYLGYFHI